MRLAPRLLLAFGFVAALSVVGLGYLVREDRRASETRRFDEEVASACRRVVAEIERQGESDRKLVAGACQSGELVDRALISLEAGKLDEPSRLALSSLVPEERQAFGLDELVLASGDGDVLGRDPTALINSPRADVVGMVAGDAAHARLRTAPEPALLVRCRKQGSAGHSVALFGARRLAPVVDRLGRTLEVRATLGPPAAASPNVAQASCDLGDVAGTTLQIFIDKPRTELVENLARIDHTILYAGLASAGVALLLAVLLARNLGRPIAELAAEARKVASGQARPLRVRGASEIAELAAAFDKMLSDLESTRRRLAASTRAAAWREVARRVAHEVKNPLAPIRAAVETLRRLRARGDPEFDRYFDEATRTVLDEVHRIANIVTEFTRFARLPPPRPQDIDVAEVARHVVRLHESTEPGAARLGLRVSGPLPGVWADRDQVVQVLTNLVQNALDAVRSKGEGGTVEITVASEAPTHVSVAVVDNGPGIEPAIAARLFEPYATTKEHGTGLGLAIAQRIAMEHGGELSYIPTPSIPGATFRLVLPVEGPPPEDTGSRAASSGRPPL
jgi:signal transduction histidine kinase